MAEKGVEEQVLAMERLPHTRFFQAFFLSGSLSAAS